ncbi:MAG: DUF6062 family protein [Alkalispirochaeta sp.]
MAHLHIDYHAVLQAFTDHPGSCPLCAAIGEAESRFWDATLYGAIGTEGFQDSFLSADGFCPHHAAVFAGHRDGTAVTMLYAPLYRHRKGWIRAESGGAVGRAIRGITRRRTGTSPAEKGRRAEREQCVLCDRIERWTVQFLTNLLRHQTDPELRRAVEASRGLCVPHYRRAVRIGGRIGFVPGRMPHRGGVYRIPRPARWMEEHHTERWDAIVTAAEESVMGAGGTAWRELLRIMEGDTAAPTETR